MTTKPLRCSENLTTNRISSVRMLPLSRTPLAVKSFTEWRKMRIPTIEADKHVPTKVDDGANSAITKEWVEQV